jgi:hypothetical protein
VTFDGYRDAMTLYHCTALKSLDYTCNVISTSGEWINAFYRGDNRILKEIKAASAAAREQHR